MNITEYLKKLKRDLTIICKKYNISTTIYERKGNKNE